MAKQHYPYARWASDKINQLDPEYRSKARDNFWSNGGRIKKYDSYKNYCKAFGYSYDPPPNGYWESKEEWWHLPVGILLGLSGLWIFFIGGIAGGSMRSKGKEW